MDAGDDVAPDSAAPAWRRAVLLMFNEETVKGHRHLGEVLAQCDHGRFSKASPPKSPPPSPCHHLFTHMLPTRQEIRALCEKVKVDMPVYLRVRPRVTLNNFYLPPWKLSFDMGAKISTGGRREDLPRCAGRCWALDCHTLCWAPVAACQQAVCLSVCHLPVYPPSITLRAVFENILQDGFEGHREPLEITWSASGEQLGAIPDFSVCYVDGMHRGLAILGVLHYLCAMDSPFFVHRHYSALSVTMLFVASSLVVYVPFSALCVAIVGRSG